MFPLLPALAGGMEPAAGTPGRGDASSGPRKAPSISPNICYFSGLFGDGAHSGETVQVECCERDANSKGKPDIETVTTSERLITRRLDLAAEHAVTFGGPTARRSL